jgi:hypothetical protein
MDSHLTSGRSGGFAGILSVLLMVTGVFYVATFSLPYEDPAVVLVAEVEENRRALGFGAFLFALAGAVLGSALGAVFGGLAMLLVVAFPLWILAASAALLRSQGPAMV